MENTFLKDMKEWENDPEYQTESLILEINEQICEWMEKKNVCRSELARRLGKSRAYVTRMLNGSHNLTIATLVKVANALGTKPTIKFAESYSIRENTIDTEDNQVFSMLFSLKEYSFNTSSLESSAPGEETVSKDTKVEEHCGIFAHAA